MSYWPYVFMQQKEPLFIIQRTIASDDGLSFDQIFVHDTVETLRVFSCLASGGKDETVGLDVVMIWPDFKCDPPGLRVHSVREIRVLSQEGRADSYLYKLRDGVVLSRRNRRKFEEASPLLVAKKRR